MFEVGDRVVVGDCDSYGWVDHGPSDVKGKAGTVVPSSLIGPRCYAVLLDGFKAPIRFNKNELTKVST